GHEEGQRHEQGGGVQGVGAVGLHERPPRLAPAPRHHLLVDRSRAFRDCATITCAICATGVARPERSEGRGCCTPFGVPQGVPPTALSSILYRRRRRFLTWGAAVG